MLATGVWISTLLCHIHVPARKPVAAIFNMIKSVFATDLMAHRSPPIYDKFW